MAAYQLPTQTSRKRTRTDDLVSYDYEGLQQLQADTFGPVPVELTPHGRHAQLQKTETASSEYVRFPSGPHSPTQSPKTTNIPLAASVNDIFFVLTMANITTSEAKFGTVSC